MKGDAITAGAATVWMAACAPKGIVVRELLIRQTDYERMCEPSVSAVTYGQSLYKVNRVELVRESEHGHKGAGAHGGADRHRLRDSARDFVVAQCDFQGALRSRREGLLRVVAFLQSM